jgi:SAM-dependent methyltransferase
MSEAELLARVEAYYSDRLREHGPTARGVDWNSEESQRLRFEQLARVLPSEGPFSVADYGCGYGALVGFLRERGGGFTYRGYDVSSSMLAEARRLWSAEPACSFVERELELGGSDYVLASGIFNVKLETGEEEWAAYVLATLRRMAALASRGLAFNVLTRYSDPPKRRSELYYADPPALFDFCKTELGSRVALLHDYPLYEFTILVRK